MTELGLVKMKLSIIRRILDCNNEEVLDAIIHILDQPFEQTIVENREEFERSILETEALKNKERVHIDEIKRK